MRQLTAYTTGKQEHIGESYSALHLEVQGEKYKVSDAQVDSNARVALLVGEWLAQYTTWDMQKIIRECLHSS